VRPVADLKAERAALDAKDRQIEIEVAPVRYVAVLIGAGTEPVGAGEPNSQSSSQLSRLSGIAALILFIVGWNFRKAINSLADGLGVTGSGN